MKGLPSVPAYITAAAIIALSAMAQADDAFMDYETDRQRTVEAVGECELSGQTGVYLSPCVSAYYCASFGDCEGESMQPIEPTPWGVYQDNIGGLTMAAKPKKGFTKESQEKREVTKKSADQRENERIRAIAERPMLSDPKSRIQDTDYWACKPK